MRKRFRLHSYVDSVRFEFDTTPGTSTSASLSPEEARELADDLIATAAVVEGTRARDRAQRLKEVDEKIAALQVERSKLVGDSTMEQIDWTWIVPHSLAESLYRPDQAARDMPEPGLGLTTVDPPAKPPVFQNQWPCVPRYSDGFRSSES